MRMSRFFSTYSRQRGATSRAGFTAALSISAILLCLPAWGAVSDFRTIDFPGAARTIAFDVNSRGDVVGVYNATCTGNVCSAARGFIWRAGAAVPESVDVPGASLTRVFGINNRGDIVGDFKLGTALSGFVRRAGSAEFVTIKYSDGSTTATRTDVQDIDEKGDAVGSFDMPSSLYGLTNTIGFIWRDGSFRRIEAPFESTYQTVLRGIDARGQAVGCYWTYAPSGNTMHSLIVTSAESFQSEDFPGSKMSMNWRISSNSLRVGHFVDFDSTTHGYILNEGEYERVDYPGAALTDTRGVASVESTSRDDEGFARVLVVGGYIDKNSRTHGYQATGWVRTERDRDRDPGPDVERPADSDISHP